MATDPRFKASAAVLASQAAAPKVQIPVSRRAVEPDRLSGTKVGELLDQLAEFMFDPLGFVMWAFPWGEPGTSLEDQHGPEEWQREQLARIGQRLREGGAAGAVIEEDTVAGRGVGKSALVSWWILWAISTHPDTRGVVTATTEGQLRTKTWAELGKWHQMFIARVMFPMTATKIAIDDPNREKTWRIDAIPWSAENVDAFNGLHNQGKRIFICFDEASGIADPIWEGTEGVLTDANTQILWLRYGNPIRTSGRFFLNCTRQKRNVVTRVDSRTVSFSNKAQIQAWIDDYTEDSDFVRVHVKGMFPRAGFSNFISPELVDQARRRRIKPSEYQAFPKILAIDPARFGDDESVITLRQGPKIHYQVALQGFDGPDLAGRIFELVRKDGPVSCIVYDAIGVGADLDSSLRRMPGLGVPLMPIQWGQPASDDKQYANQRAEAWGKFRDWLESGQVPDEDDFALQATSVDYAYDAKFRIQLQSKKDIRKNGGKSPDKIDSACLSMLPDVIQFRGKVAKVRPVQRRTIIWSK